MKTLMKASVLLCLTLALAACTTTTTTKVTTYDSTGAPVTSEVTSTTRNDTVDKARQIGSDVKEGVVSGYEWTKDKTVKGYQWVKEKSVNAYESMTK